MRIAQWPPFLDGFGSQSSIKCLDFSQQPQAQINRYLRCEPICLFHSAGNGAMLVGVNEA